MAIARILAAVYTSSIRRLGIIYRVGIGKYRESIDGPRLEYQMGAETQKIADIALLPGDECRTCKKRRADILRLLCTVPNFTYRTLI